MRRPCLDRFAVFAKASRSSFSQSRRSERSDLLTDWRSPGCGAVRAAEHRRSRGSLALTAPRSSAPHYSCAQHAFRFERVADVWWNDTQSGRRVECLLKEVAPTCPRSRFARRVQASRIFPLRSERSAVSAALTLRSTRGVASEPVKGPVGLVFRDQQQEKPRLAKPGVTV